MDFLFCRLRRVLAIRKDQAMTFILGGIALVICIGLALQGYVVSLIVGGILGSFLGIAGFGTAVPGTLAGAIVGALIAIALKKETRPSEYSSPQATNVQSSGATPVNTPHKNTEGIFASAVRGFGDGLTSAEQPAKQKQGLVFWNVIVLCILGAWLIATRQLTAMHASFFSDPAFSLGLMVAPASILVGLASLGWLLGKLLFPSSSAGSWMALLIGIGAFYVLVEEQPVRPATNAHPVESGTNAATRETSISSPTQNNVQPQDAYNVAVSEIEKKYPQLNPAAKDYDQALAREVVRRSAVYVQAGAAPADALKRVILEMERARDASKRSR